MPLLRPSTLFARMWTTDRYGGALVCLGAAGMFLGQPNPFFHLPPLVLFFPFGLHLLAAQASSDGNAFFRCWLLGLAAHAAGLYWLIHPMHDVGGLSYALAWPGVLLLSAYLACYSALAGLAMRRIRRIFTLDGQKRSMADKTAPGLDDPLYPTKGRPALCAAAGSEPVSRRGAFLGQFLAACLVPLLSGCVYAGCEVLCGALFTGFPWLSLSSAFALWPAWIQAASLVGSYGLSACFAALACLGASAILAPCRSGRFAAALGAAALTAAFPLYGHYRLALPLPERSGSALKIVMVQGNIDQNQKWQLSMQQETIAHYLNLSSRALDSMRKAHPDDTPDLVLWPETAMPFYFHAQPEFAERLRRFAAGRNVNLAFGTLGTGRNPPDAATPNRLYNRLYLIAADGRVAGMYDKQHLVPFGEYIPFASSLTFLQNLAQGLDFSPGDQRPPLPLASPRPRPDPLADAPLPQDKDNGVMISRSDQTGQYAPLGALICYEAIFPSLAQQQVENGATALINISNDGWFGNSSAPLEHLGLTAMRAVEQARPIARATNTGYTAAIDARGRVYERLDRLFVADTLVASLLPSTEITLYHRLHPAPEVLLAALALFWVAHQFVVMLRQAAVLRKGQDQKVFSQENPPMATSRKRRALALFSGGLDSLLAAKLLQEQGIDVICLHFVSPFFGKAEKVSHWESLYDLPIRVVDIAEPFARMLVKWPEHGFGSVLNPCLDCKILMLRRAASLMEETGACCIVSGEVLGQRPMSQRRDALNIIRREAGVKDQLLRPLSALHLDPVAAERSGLIDRARLLGISGRGRKEQLALAARFGLREIPTPAGGCRLTEQENARSYWPVLRYCPEPSAADFRLANAGRQFWREPPLAGQPAHWLCIGRNQDDNKALMSLAVEGDLLFTPRDFPGPVALGRRFGSDWPLEIVRSAAAFSASYAPKCLRYASDSGEPVAMRVHAASLENPGQTLTVVPSRCLPLPWREFPWTEAHEAIRAEGKNRHGSSSITQESSFPVMG